MSKGHVNEDGNPDEVVRKLKHTNAVIALHSKKKDRAIDVLIAAGFITQDNFDKAMELVDLTDTLHELKDGK